MVVGAGIIGAAAAYQLARRGMAVTVVDKAAGPAEGSTGASSSIVRCRYTHPEVVRLAQQSLEAFSRWPDFLASPSATPRLQQVGVLWLLDLPPQQVEADRERLAGQGVAVEVIDPGELRRRFPALSACVAPFDLTGEVAHHCREVELALFETAGGYADPWGCTVDLLDAARRHGAEVRFRSPVAEVRRAGGRVEGVTLADGSRIAADVVVNAAGPWATRLNRMAGVDLAWTLHPTRVQVLYRGWPSDLGALPVVAESSAGLYLRPDGPERLLFGSVLPEDEEEVVDDPDDFRRGADAAFRDSKIHALHHRIPPLEHRGTVTGIAGLYTINREDAHPLVGQAGPEGYWVACGFSGHGFKLAPMVGSLLAQGITGERADFDTDIPLDFLSPHRSPLPMAAKTVLA